MKREKLESARKKKLRGYLITIFVVGAVALYFHFLRFNGIHNSAALYIGLSLLIVLGIALSGESNIATRH